MPHVRVVGLADEEVHVEVGKIHFGRKIIAAKELLNAVKPLHLEVLDQDLLVGLVEIHTSPHLAKALLRDGEEVDHRPSKVSGCSSSTELILG